MGFGLSDGDGLTGAWLAVNLHFYWLNCGFFGEGRRWLDRVLALSLPDDLRVHALWVNAYATAGLGEGQAAVRMGELAVELARQLGDDELLSLALYGRATTALVTSDHPTADKCYGESVECYNRVKTIDQTGAAGRRSGRARRHEQGDRRPPQHFPADGRGARRPHPAQAEIRLPRADRRVGCRKELVSFRPRQQDFLQHDQSVEQHDAHHREQCHGRERQ